MSLQTTFCLVHNFLSCRQLFVFDNVAKVHLSKPCRQLVVFMFWYILGHLGSWALVQDPRLGWALVQDPTEQRLGAMWQPHPSPHIFSSFLMVQLVDHRQSKGGDNFLVVLSSWPPWPTVRPNSRPWKSSTHKKALGSRHWHSMMKCNFGFTLQLVT